MKSLSTETLTETPNPGFVREEGDAKGEREVCKCRKGIWLLKPEESYRSFSDRD